MSKICCLKTHLTVTLFLLTCNFCAGQSIQYIYQQYLRDYVYFKPSNFLIDQRFSETRSLPAKVTVEIDNLSNLDDLIAHGITKNIYGISLSTKDSVNFYKSISRLVNFPNLEFLQIKDMELFGNYRKDKFQLPASISTLTQVRLVELYGTKNIDLPDAIFKLSKLKNLIGLSFFAQPGPLPQQITALKNIKVIKLSTTNLDGLDLHHVTWQLLKIYGAGPNKDSSETMLRKIAGISSLRALTLEYCNVPINTLDLFQKLSSLSLATPKLTGGNLFKSLSGLTSLQNLSITHVSDSTQRLDGIEALGQLSALTLWNFGSLIAHPEQLQKLGRLKALRSLRLESNKASVIPDFFSGTTSLRWLAIGGFDLTDAIEGIFRLPALDTMIISANELKALPAPLKYGCSKLKLLDLRYNKISVLPGAILSLKQLQSLDVSNNRLTIIPSMGWETLHSLNNVNLSSNQITMFPAGMQLIRKLTELNLSQNKISSFPEVIEKGYQLTLLDISGNQLTQLPANIGNFKNLEVLNVAFNKLTSLPFSLGECKKIKHLDLNNNQIAALPSGLIDSKNLEVLNLSENTGIDPVSVFNVLLAIPRHQLSVDLSKVDLKSIPADHAWRKVSFSALNLNGNKLTTLPAEFAQMKSFSNLTINNNAFDIDPFICDRPIKNRSDIKILYNELGIEIPDNDVPDSAYASSLAERVTDYYVNKKYGQAIAYADKATLVDSVAYGNTVAWEDIGISRYNSNDYNGAIRDFNHFITRESTKGIHWGSSLDQVEFYKSDAHLKLGEKDKAAETHIYFAKQHHSINGFALAAVLYMELGDKRRAKSLMDTAVKVYEESKLARSRYKDSFDPPFVLEYAEVLLIADTPVEVIRLLSSYEDKLFTKEYLAIKNYLLNTAMYLNGQKSYKAACTDLNNSKLVNGKISGWSSDMFNDWMKIAVKSAEKQQQLLDLQNAAR